jgi:hypothetical protein
MGHNTLDECQKLVSLNLVNWSKAKIVVFDVPNMVDNPYKERLKKLTQSNQFYLFLTNLDISVAHPLLAVVDPVMCTDRQHFDRFFNEVCQNRPVIQRGEGIVLRDPNAWYFQKDSFFVKEVLSNFISSNTFSF